MDKETDRQTETDRQDSDLISAEVVKVGEIGRVKRGTERQRDRKT